MPYIDAESRRQIMHGRPPLTAGELNYVFCNAALSGCYTTVEMMQICRTYLNHTKSDYQHMNDVVGALDGAFTELVRRTNEFYPLLTNTKKQFQKEVVAPYEDKKILQHGDIL